VRQKASANSGKLTIMDAAMVAGALLLVILTWWLYRQSFGAEPWQKCQKRLKHNRIVDLRKRLANARRQRQSILRALSGRPHGAEVSPATQALCEVETKLLDDLRKVESQSTTIKEVTIGHGAMSRVEKCMSCHDGIDKADSVLAPEIGLRTHPEAQTLFRHHPVKKFGCTVCHDGNGSDLNFPHGNILKGEMVQSSCARCHEDAPLLAGAPSALKGARLFQSRGCQACHNVKGSVYITVNAERPGPELTHLAGKVDLNWLVSWIQSPRKVHSRTLMPEFGEKGKGLPQREAEQIAAFLLNNSSPPFLTEAALAYGKSRDNRTENAVGSEKGRKIFLERGCLACHELGKLRSSGPKRISLDAIGDKVSHAWLYSWLEDPARISPDTAMPKFDLKSDEIESLCDFLMSYKSAAPVIKKENTSGTASMPALESGKKLIGKYGCYGCHRIAGFEKVDQPVGPELSNFGAKESSVLLWGKQNAVPRGKRSWYTWTIAKLKNPHVFDTKRIKAGMPDFHLSQLEIEQLLVFLKSLSDSHSVPTELRRTASQGQKDRIASFELIHEHGCLGCHSMYDSSHSLSMGGFSKVPAICGGVLAPNLSGDEGRFETSWLRRFLQAPSVVRPNLSARMPKFNFEKGELEPLLGYFSAATVAEMKTTSRLDRSLAVADEVASGVRLVKRLQCGNCHNVAGKPITKGSHLIWYHDIDRARLMAPDLSLAGERLQVSWMSKWLKNPYCVLPTTTMPGLPLTADEVDSLVHYLNSLDHGRIDIRNRQGCLNGSNSH